MLTMKKYVGTAKMRPDSRTPRRLPKAMRAMNPSEIGTRHGARAVTDDQRGGAGARSTPPP